MQTLQDIQDKIFFETRSILETLCKIDSTEELLSKRGLFSEVTDRIAFLRILEKNENNFAQILVGEDPDRLAINDNQIIDEATEHVELNDRESVAENIEEEVFTNELNHFQEGAEEEANTLGVQPESVEESDHQIKVDDVAESNMIEEEIPFTVEQEEADYADRIAQKERDLAEMEERRRRIVEFSKQEGLPEDSTELKTESPQEQVEKKFKLANIKGLKVVQHLFNNDPIEEEETTEKGIIDSGSLLKMNVKTDFMEAEKKKPEFRLDLNDKVAFSKSLFGGNDQELKETIEKLNSFDNLEDAKQYLSEVYYHKDWSKVDEFAQRLWNLVESKF